MTKAKQYTDKNGEVRELDEEFFSTARRGRPPMPAEVRKVRMNLMIDADLAEKLKAVGNKSAFVAEALRKALG